MAGICAYGAYVPMLRLALGKKGGPEKAVANWDEDAVTMAVAAAIDALRGVDRASVDAVYFASTSYPFKEKQGAAIIAKALDLRRDVYTADVGDSLRASGVNDAHVRLSWGATPGAAKYRVYRAPGPQGPFVQLTETTQLVWEDRDDLGNLNPRYYVVRAADSCGNEGP